MGWQEEGELRGLEGFRMDIKLEMSRYVGFRSVARSG